MKRPFLKFYPSDWRSDPALKLCSLSARGLWMEMLCLMHEAEPYGHLKVRGVPLDASALAALVGASEESVRACLHELEFRGVLSRNRDGVVFSRRMIRDAERDARDRANGARGGNPHLRKQTGKAEKIPMASSLSGMGVNPPVKGADKGGDKAQIPDTRYGEPSVSYETSGSSKADLDRVVTALWRLWPSKARKRHALSEVRKAVEATLRRGGKPEEIILAGERHVAERMARGEEFVKGLVPWLRNDLWRNWLADEGSTVVEASPELWARRVERWRGNREAWNPVQWGPPPDQPGYRGPSLQAKTRFAEALL